MFVLSATLLLFGPASVRAADQAGKKGPSVEEQATRLRADLKSADVETRQAAVRSLPHNAAAALLMPDLMAALKDSDGEVASGPPRFSSAGGSVRRRGAATRRAVAERLDQAGSRDGARALGRIGKAVPSNRTMVAPLEKAATDDADSVTRVVASARCC